MFDLKIISKYPFLSDSKIYVKEKKLSIIEILQDPLYDRARAISVERLDNAFEKKDAGNRALVSNSDMIMELLSYPISRMISVCIGDIYFNKRYALGEAVHAYKNLLNEKTEFLIEVAKEFSLDVKYDSEKNDLKIYFVNYLRYAPTRYMQWKMINRELKEGYVKIDHKGLSRIIQEALRKRINEELANRQCEPLVDKIFNEDIRRIRNQVLLYRKKIEKEPIKELDITKLPPCMKRILAAIQSGENVPHVGRFAIVSFLSSLNLSTNEIIKLFSKAPDFEEDKSRYQIEHITGKISSTQYTPPGCDKMRTYGLCPTDEIDDLCKRKRHPLSYYKAKWYKEKKKK